MKRIIDVTQPLRAGDPGVNWDTAKTLERDGWNARTLHLYSHAGTHMDAPVHFGAGNTTIDQLPLSRLMVNCHLIDLNGIAPHTRIEIADIGLAVDKVTPGEGLIFRTGWHKRYGTPSFREGIPGISDELAHWCVDRQVGLIAVEPPSVADVNNLPEVTRIHSILLSAGIVIVEGLADLSSVQNHYVELIALPLKIAGGDGSPCRAVIID
jgi:arylformamidase